MSTENNAMKKIILLPVLSFASITASYAVDTSSLLPTELANVGQVSPSLNQDNMILKTQPVMQLAVSPSMQYQTNSNMF